MGVMWINNREDAFHMVKKMVVKTHTVLDIGSGIRPQTFFNPSVHICGEPHLPYLERLRCEVSDESRYILFNCTWDVVMKPLLAKSVDTVFAIDFIEHVDKKEGLDFLQEAERVARRQIVVFTPLGFYPQSYEDPHTPDRWGMDGGYWQTHRSGWQVEDFDNNWELICCEAYHFYDENNRRLEKPFGAIWAFRNFDEANKLSFNYQWYMYNLKRSTIGKLKQFHKFLIR